MLWGRPLFAAKGERAAKSGRGVSWVAIAPFLPPSPEADRRQRTAFGATPLPRPSVWLDGSMLNFTLFDPPHGNAKDLLKKANGKVFGSF